MQHFISIALICTQEESTRSQRDEMQCHSIVRKLCQVLKRGSLKKLPVGKEIIGTMTCMINWQYQDEAEGMVVDVMERN